MSESRQFCPRCGDPVERPSDEAGGRPGGAAPGLCDACYLDEFDLVDAPERVEVTVCSDCGAVRRGNRWVDVGARDYTDVAVEATTEALGVHLDAEDVEWAVTPEQVDPNTIRMHCLFTGVVRGQPVEEEVTVPVYVGRGTCDRCGRIAGDSHAAVVQVRGTDRAPTDRECRVAVETAQSYVADREEKGDRNAYITEVTETGDGVDLKLGETQMADTVARRITDRLGGDVSSSERLITEDGDGNRVYRVTFLARLPPYTPGDVVDPEDGDGPVVVTSAHGRLKGIRLATGDRYEASHEDGIDPDVRRLGSREDATETTLVAIEDDRAIQVLDPETYEAVTVPWPDYLSLDGADDRDTVRVVKTRAGVHVVPDEGGTDQNGAPE